jgi:hypothetical protein
MIVVYGRVTMRNHGTCIVSSIVGGGVAMARLIR